ncbi:MAG: hypothetical protein HRF49_01505 [bacterium]|jgi:hypothetical protein
MAKKKKQNDAAERESPQPARPPAAAPAEARGGMHFAGTSFFLFILTASLVGWAFFKNTKAVNENLQYGLLPPTIPRSVPFPKSIFTVEKATVEDCVLTEEKEDGSKAEKPGKKFTVEGTTDRPPSEVRDFYNEFLLDRGFRQRSNIGMPTGQFLQMDNDKLLVDITAEKLSKDPKTRVKIEIYQ